MDRTSPNGPRHLVESSHGIRAPRSFSPGIDWTGGYVAMPRALRDPGHPLHPRNTGERASKAYAFEDLIHLARWKVHEGVPRGCAPASLRFLADRWNWPKTSVARFLGQLEANRDIELIKQSKRNPTVIRVVGFEGIRTRSLAASSGLTWDGLDPTPDTKNGRSRDTKRDAGWDEEKAFTTRELEVRLEGRRCPECQTLLDTRGAADEDREKQKADGVKCGSCEARAVAESWQPDFGRDQDPTP